MILQKNIVFITKLPTAVASRRIQEATEARRMMRLSRFRNREDSKAYEGSVQDSGFDIKRIINYKNSFRPRIVGTISEGQEGTRISVKMSMEKFVAAFVILTMVVAVVCLFVTMWVLFSEPKSASGWLSPLVFLTVWNVIAFVAFRLECNVSKKGLAKIFEAKIED